jgi:hypothetical protein
MSKTPSAQVAWSTQSHETKGGYEYRCLTVRWNLELHEALGHPSFMSCELSRDPSGNVYATLGAQSHVKRQFSWSVRPVKSQYGNFFGIVPSLRPDIRDDANLLGSETAEMSPAEAWISNGSLVVKLITAEPPAEAREAAQTALDLPDPQPPALTRAALEGPVWATVKLAQKQVALAEADVEHAQAHRRTIEERYAAERRSNEEFRAQILRDTKIQTDALVSIATSLTVLTRKATADAK